MLILSRGQDEGDVDGGMASDRNDEEEEDSVHCAAGLVTNRPFPAVEEPETSPPPLLFGGYV